MLHIIKKLMEILEMNILVKKEIATHPTMSELSEKTIGIKSNKFVDNSDYKKVSF